MRHMRNCGAPYSKWDSCQAGPASVCECNANANKACRSERNVDADVLAKAQQIAFVYAANVR